jgi:hypothetical protein
MHLRSIVAIVAGLLVAPSAASATTFNVNSQLDEVDATANCVCATASGACSLRAAIEEANSCQVDPVNEVILDPGVYDLTITGPGGDDEGDLDITYNVDMKAARPGTVTVKALGLSTAGDPQRVLDVAVGASLAVRSIRLESGEEFVGGVLRNLGTAKLVGSDVYKGFAGSPGAGGCIYNEGDLELYDLEVFDCETDGYGGGLANIGTATAIGVVFRDNVAVGSGGGIGNFGQLSLAKAQLRSNESGIFGGALWTYGTADVTDAEMTSNTADYGGAVGVQSSGVAMLERVIVSDNVALTRGGGLRVSGANAELHAIELTCTANQAISSGGGCFGVTHGLMTFANSSIHGNRARLGGGGISQFGTTELRDTTLYGNEAYQYDGGGFRGIMATTRFDNVTIASNRAAHEGGGMLVAGGTTELKNSILDDNTDAWGSPQCHGTVDSLGHNRILSLLGCSWNGATGDSFGTSSLDPLVVSATPGYDHAPLQAGSAAIDTADPAACSTTDQIFQTRQGVCDRGAVEAP